MIKTIYKQINNYNKRRGSNIYRFEDHHRKKLRGIWDQQELFWKPVRSHNLGSKKKKKN
jgi:hypothetical protein